MGSKKVKKLKEKGLEDRISNLPDSILHHILSFLPSTKQVIQTSVLSKQWHKQWTQVPVLIFDPSGMSYENFLQFIHNTLILHNSSKIEKFHLQYPEHHEKDPQFDAKIQFAITKYVEDLNLMIPSTQGSYELPKFVFNKASLVKLRTFNFVYMPDGKVNWKSLTALNIERCSFPDNQGIEHILSGSPLLKSLELSNSGFEDKFVIVSKSLKRLVLLSFHTSAIEISCPNLEELSLNNLIIYLPAESFAESIKNALSISLLLESFELIDCILPGQLIIVSKSLKRLVLGYLSDTVGIEISCPTLEKLKLFGYLDVSTLKLLNLPSSLSATMDFYLYGIDNFELDIRKDFTTNILQQLQHVKELRIENGFLKFFPRLEGEDCFLPLFNMKCLTLSYRDLNKRPSEIACVLYNSNVLEKLEIDVPIHDQHKFFVMDWTDSGENYWNVNAAIFNCFVSHLKIIKFIGFPRRIDKYEPVPSFVRFLLKNTRVLEKMVVELNVQARDYPFEVSQQELMSLPRCSQNAIIEVL